MPILVNSFFDLVPLTEAALRTTYMMFPMDGNFTYPLQSPVDAAAVAFLRHDLLTQRVKLLGLFGYGVLVHTPRT